jgi:hypothetical protein
MKSCNEKPIVPIASKKFQLLMQDMLGSPTEGRSLKENVQDAAAS